MSWVFFWVQGHAFCKRSVAGLSLRTQCIYLALYVSRYLDLFDHVQNATRLVDLWVSTRHFRCLTCYSFWFPMRPVLLVACIHNLLFLIQLADMPVYCDILFRWVFKPSFLWKESHEAYLVFHKVFFISTALLALLCFSCWHKTYRSLGQS